MAIFRRRDFIKRALLDAAGWLAVPRRGKAPPPYTRTQDAVWEAQQKGLKPNGDLRGQKGTVYNGGFRVPFIARWPGHIPAKSESGQMVCLVDMLATLAELTGVALSAARTGGAGRGNGSRESRPRVGRARCRGRSRP
jgi:hypothetical protein